MTTLILVRSTLLGSDILILIFSVKLQETKYQQLQQPQVHYLLRVQLLGSHLDREVFVGPQRIHILKRETLIKAGPLGRDSERRVDCN